MRHLTIIAPLLLAANLAACWQSPQNYHRQLWWKTLPDLGYVPEQWSSGMPATDGRSFYLDVGHSIVALDVRNGEARWTSPFRDRTNPAVEHFVVDADQVLFTITGAAFALARADGRLQWRTIVDSLSAQARPAADSTTLYAGTAGAAAIALDRANGAVRWTTAMRQVPTFPAYTTGLTVSHDTVFVATEQWRSENGEKRMAVISALDRRTGRQLWRWHSTGDTTGVSDAGALADRTIVFSDGFGTSFFALDRATGKEIWRVFGDRVSRFSGPSTSPIVRGDTVYVGSNDTWVYAANAGTGRLLWKTKTETSIRFIALCRDLLLARNQTVEFLDRSSGRLHQSYLGDFREQSHPGYPMSGVVVADDVAMVAGTAEVVGFRCGKHARD